MHSAGRKLIKELEVLGFEFVRQNSKSKHVYKRKGHPPVVIPVASDENACNQVLRKVKRNLGILEEQPKRRKENVQARQSHERDQAAAQYEKAKEAYYDVLHRKEEIREQALNGAAKRLNRKELRALEKEIKRLDAERARWERLMQRVPASNEHRGKGRPRHRTGKEYHNYGHQ